MTSCCHCRRAIYYAPSVKRHCGSWCYYNKGPCLSNYDHTHDEPEHSTEGLRKKLDNGLAMGVISGAALGVACVLSHGACIIMAFAEHHNYLKPIATAIYSVLKNKSESDKHNVDVLSNAAGSDALSSELGNKFAEITNQELKDKVHITSLSWAREIGKETFRGMLKGGYNAVFDWGSKAIV